MCFKMIYSVLQILLALLHTLNGLWLVLRFIEIPDYVKDQFLSARIGENNSNLFETGFILSFSTNSVDKVACPFKFIILIRFALKVTVCYHIQ